MGDTHGKHLRQIPESCQLRDRAAADRKDSPRGLSWHLRGRTECPCGLSRQDADHILTSCPTYANMRNEVLWNEAREPDYRRILSQGPLVKKAAQFMLRTRLLGQFRTLPTESQPAARRSPIRLQSGTHKTRRPPCSLPLGA